MRIMTVMRGDDLIETCYEPWHVPNAGDTLLLAKWDTVYIVEKVATFISPSAQTVQVYVKIKNRRMI